MSDRVIKFRCDECGEDVTSTVTFPFPADLAKSEEVQHATDRARDDHARSIHEEASA